MRVLNLVLKHILSVKIILLKQKFVPGEIETAPDNYSIFDETQLYKWIPEYDPNGFSYLHVYFPVTGHAPETYYLAIDTAARAQQAAKLDKMGKFATAICVYDLTLAYIEKLLMLKKNLREFFG